MDQVSFPYFSMTTGVQNQLCDEVAVMRFVDEMRELIEKSAPLKNFVFDTTTPHGDVVLTESSAMKPGVGWITLHATEGIRHGIHEWCIKIENQGETTDGSGLMLGIVPSNYCRYDTFISQGGGWCLSRAGKFYGQWRRLNLVNDATNTVVFSKDDRVILLLDYDNARLSVRVGSNVVVGEISNLAPEVFPAVSLHYKTQQVRFEYHIVHNRNARQVPWIGRPILRPPTAFMSFSLAQLNYLKLDSFVFSPMFVDRVPEWKKLDKKSHGLSETKLYPLDLGSRANNSHLSPLTVTSSDSNSASYKISGTSQEVVQLDNAQASANSNCYTEGQLRKNPPYSLGGAAGRMIILCNTFSSLQRHTEGAPPQSPYLSSSVTAEYLRKRMYELHRSRDESSKQSTQYDGLNATFNCGAIIMSHMFTRVAGESNSAIALPLVFSLMDYLESLPLFGLSEAQDSPFLSPDILQLTVNNVVKLLENASQVENHDSGGLNSLHVSLIELTVILALQRGLVSETLRSCRFLFRFPNQVVSPRLLEWLRRVRYKIQPHALIPDIYSALQFSVDRAEKLTVPGVSSKTIVFSTAFYHEMIYIHTSKELSKWGKSGPIFIKLYCTSEPATCFQNVEKSAIAATATKAIFITDSMMRENIAVIVYSVTLEAQQTFYLKDLHDWPNSSSMPIITSGLSDEIFTVHVFHPNLVGDSSSRSIESATGPAILSPSSNSAVGFHEVTGTLSSSSTELPQTNLILSSFNFNCSTPKVNWRTTLSLPPAEQFSLSYCVALQKSSLINLGSPEEVLSSVGGHVTVELYLMLLEKEDIATTIYQHGSPHSSGTVFIETARLEGALCIRGGYRHNAHGSSVVFAPVPPTSDGHFMHITLVFCGSWKLYFDGIEVGGSLGLQAAVLSPRQIWSIGPRCICRLAGLRVWRRSRGSREISRDYMRVLSGKEDGLVCQMFFNEPSGNVVFNHVSYPSAQHGICTGNYARVQTKSHPWNSHLTEDSVVPVMPPLHNWHDISSASLFAFENLIGLVHHLNATAPYPDKTGQAVLFFDPQNGVSYRSMCLIPSLYKAKGSMGFDHAGHLLELVENSSETMLTGTSSIPERVVSVVCLFSEDQAAVRTSDPMSRYSFSCRRSERFSTSQECTPSCAFDNSKLPVSPSSSLQGDLEKSSDDQYSSSQLPYSEVFNADREPLTFMELATWLLQLLCKHADKEPEGTGALFSHLSDDVSRQCVEEIKTLLIEHFRVVKGSNARRAVSFKSPVSTMVVSSVLRILLRLVRRARAFALHPSVLGLNVMDTESRSDGAVKDTNLWVRRVTSSSYFSGSPLGSCVLTNPTSPNGAINDNNSSPLGRSAGGVDSNNNSSSFHASILHGRRSMKVGQGSPLANSSTASLDSADVLLALLGDIVNESGTTVSPHLGNSAKAVLFEGIELFFPSVRCRVNLLREMLSIQSSPLSPSTSSSFHASRKQSASSQSLADKTPAVELLMNAMVNSLGSVLSAITLLTSINDDGENLDTAPRTSDNQNVSGMQYIEKTLKALIDESLFQIRRRSTQELETSSLSSFSERNDDELDGWGSPDALSLPGSSRMNKSRSIPQKCKLIMCLAQSISSLQLLLLSSCFQGRANDNQITTTLTTDLFSFPIAVISQPHIISYYEKLFQASEEGLRLILGKAIGNSTGSSSSLNTKILRLQLELFHCSFMCSPLYTAISAIPLAVTVEDAEWYLTHLEALLPLCEDLKKAYQNLQERWEFCVEAVQSPAGALYDTVFFTSTWIATLMAQYSIVSTVSSNSLPFDASRMNDEVVDEEDGNPSSSNPTITLDEPKPPVAGNEEKGPHSLMAPKPLGLASCHRSTLMNLCDHPLLSGGLPLEAGDHPSKMKPVCHRRQFVVSLLKEKNHLLRLQRPVDPLGSKAPPEFAHAVSYMALTAIYLSNTPNLSLFSKSRLNELVVDTMKRFFIVRTAWLNELTGKSKEKRLLASQEIVHRMKTLLCFTSVHGIDPLHEKSNLDPQVPPFCADIDILQEMTDIRHAPDFPSNIKSRWKWAIRQVRSRMLRHRADLFTNNALSLLKSVWLVSTIASPKKEEEESFTAEDIKSECHKRNKFVAIRVRGFQHLLRLLLREPAATRSISLVLTCSRPQLYRHYLSGVNSADRGAVQRITATLYQLIQCLKNFSHSSETFQRSAIPAVDSMQGNSSTPSTVLSDITNRKWEPRDFIFICRLSVVEAIFNPSCSIFTAGVEADDVCLKPIGEGERSHRIAMKEYAKYLMMPSKEASEEDQSAKSLIRTTEESCQYSALSCLKYLALQSAAALREDLPVTSACGCCAFLSQLFSSVNRELERCHTYLVKKDIQTGNVECISDQVFLLTSLIGVVVAALPSNAQIIGELHNSFSIMACTLSLFVTHDFFCCSTDSYSLRGAACLRVAGKLLSHINPMIANKYFNGNAMAQSISAVYFHTTTSDLNATLCFFFSLIVRSLIGGGLNSVSQHLIITVRELLQAPRWGKLLEHVAPAFQEDLLAFVAVVTGDGGCTEGDDLHFRTSTALKMYVWGACLGGCLLFLPSPGLQARFMQEDSVLQHECFILDCERENITVVPNKEALYQAEDTSSTISSRLNESSDEKKKVLNEKDRTISEDNVFMRSFESQVEIPAYNLIVERFIAPCLDKILPIIERSDITSLDLAICTSFLSIALQLVKQPHWCLTLINNGCLRLIHHFASHCVPREALPVMHLKEFSAYAISFLMKSPFSSGKSAPDARIGVEMGGKFSADVKACASPSWTSASPGGAGQGGGRRTVLIPTPPTLFSWTQARYKLINSREEQFSSPTIRMSFPGIPPLRHPSFPPTVLCFPVGREKNVAYVTVSKAADPETDPRLLNWGPGGISLEAAFFLSDRAFPALGEEYTIPSRWSHPELCFDIFTVFAVQTTVGGGKEEIPLLHVFVRERELVCTLFLGDQNNLEVTLGIQPHDFDAFMYLGVFLDSEGLALWKGRDSAARRFTEDVSSLLEQRRALSHRQGGITLLLIGTPPQLPTDGKSTSVDDAENTEHYLLLRDVYFSNASQSSVSLLAVADEVLREQTLKPRAADEEACYFSFFEGSGNTVISSNQQYIGLLKGNVRWVAYTRKGMPPVSLECREKLKTGTNSVRNYMLPRKEIQAFFSSMDSGGLEYAALSLFESLSAHLCRMVVIEALKQSMSPDYDLFLMANNVEKTFEAVKFFEEGCWAKQMGNLLRYSDSGVLQRDHLELIQSFVQQAVLYCSKSEMEMRIFFEETASTVRDTIHFSTEIFPVEIPSLAHTVKVCPLMPLAFLNGGDGCLSFNVKNRCLEHANVFKDRTQKTILAKFPDNKGCWLNFPIPWDAPWLYVRNFPLSRYPEENTRTVALNVMLRSMRPAVVSAFFHATCVSLTQKPPRYECALSYYLSSLLMSSMLPRENVIDTEQDAIHAASNLSSIFYLWFHFPNEQPFDRSPLPIMLAQLNTALVPFLNRKLPGQEDGQMVLPALETYNSYTRQLVGLLLIAIRLETVWNGKSYRFSVWERWRRLSVLWEQSATHISTVKEDGETSTRAGKSAGNWKIVKKRIRVAECTTSGRKRLIDLKPIEQPLNSPLTVIHERGSGEWFIKSEKDAMTVRSSVGFTKGRFYFEVRMPDSNANINLLSAGFVTDKWIQKSTEGSSAFGQDVDSWCFDIAHLCAFFQGCRTDFSNRVKWKMGDVGGILLDLEANRLVCFHNDRQVCACEKLKIYGSTSSGSLPIFVPVVRFGSSGCTVNFGSAAFSCPLPPGALPVDPSHFYTPEATRIWFTVSALEWAEQLADGAMSNGFQGVLKSVKADVHRMMKIQEIFPLSVGNFSSPLMQQSARSQAQPRQLQSAALCTLLKHVSAHAAGRSGALSVDLLSSTERLRTTSNEVRVDETPCLIRGSVCVFSGKWYYEVVTRDEVGLSIGWAAADHLGEWNKTRFLGDDEYSWAFEGSRMIAKHNKRQINLNRHTLKSGNVVGCLLDCDAGTISFTINGNIQREVYNTSGDGVLFRDVKAFQSGMTPAVSMEPKSDATFMWNSEDLLYLPSGYKPLGLSSALTEGLTDYFLFSLDASFLVHGSTSQVVRSLANEKQKKTSKYRGETMEKLIFLSSQSVNVSRSNLSVYCLEKVLGVPLEDAHEEDDGVLQKKKSQTEPLGDDEKMLKRTGNALGLSPQDLRSYLVVLHILSAAVERIFPFCYEGTIATDGNPMWMGFSPISSAYATLKSYCLSFFHLRVLRRLLMTTNGPGEKLRLTLHRRKAIMLGRNPRESAGLRLTESLFGQVYHLLSSKSSILFSTNKKLWSVCFFGEGADDVGGPYRESLSQICTELMGTMLPLFLPSPNQLNEIGDSRDTFVLSPTVHPPVELGMFQFLGRLIGGCLRSAEPLSLSLPSAAWKALVGDTADISDLERVDVSTVQSLRYISNLISSASSHHRNSGAKTGVNVSPSIEQKEKLNKELAELIPDGFVITDDAGFQHRLTTFPSYLEVNSENAAYYIFLTVFFKLHILGSAPLEALKEGFFQVVPLYHISGLKWYELEAVVCGQSDYDSDELLDNARYENISADDPRVLYLRGVLKEFTSHQRASFMRFVTGRERLPPGMQIRIMPDRSEINFDGSTHDGDHQTRPSINSQLVANPVVRERQRSGALSQQRSTMSNTTSATKPNSLFTEDVEPYDDIRLPHASTCFYWLSLPKYSSKEILREKLLFAIEQCLDIDADFRVRDQDTIVMDTQPALVPVSVDDEEFEDYSHLR